MVTIAQASWCLGSKATIFLPLLIRPAWIKWASSLTLQPYRRIVLRLHLHTTTPSFMHSYGIQFEKAASSKGHNNRI